MKKGIIFNIQRYTINDGPGIRTEIFVKGCPLACKWCSNPEGQKAYIEPGVYSSKCISDKKCGLCIDACRNRALVTLENAEGESRIIGIDRSICARCMKCSSVCPTEAIRPWGEAVSVDDVMRIVEKDRSFYDSSNGGITISGGEPLVQWEFTMKLLKACREVGINTCLESTFHMNWEIVSRVVSHADLLISDIKIMDDEKHREWTGEGNSLILDNLRKLALNGHTLILRIPVIPGINDDMTNIEKTADFIETHIGKNLKVLQLLSFMHMGEEKCMSLGRKYEMDWLDFDREKFQARVKEISDYFNERGINCVVGTNE